MQSLRFQTSRPPRRLWRGSLVLATAIALAAGLAACAPGSGASSGGSGGAVSTTFDTKTPVTITVSDGWGTSGTGATFGDLIKRFEKKYPNVTIKRETTDYNTYTSSIRLKASSPTPPDVMMLTTAGYGQGFYDLVRAGLLLPLDGYSKAYNWPSRVGSDSALNVFRFDSKNGNQWGTGSLYGVPEQNALIVVYYNKALLAKAGIDKVPTTFADFEASLKAAKAAGLTGISESSTYIHTEMALWGAFASSADQVNPWVYGASGTFSDPANVKAAQTIQDWQSAGYFEDGASGTSDSDAAGAFLGGKTVYYIEGSWMAGGVDSSLKADGGAFMLPSVSAKSPAGGGLSTPLVISSKSKHQAVDAAFLNFFLGATSSDFLYKGGWGVPGGLVSSPDVATGATSSAVLKYIAAQAAGGGTIPFLDWAAPQFTTLLPTDLQNMAAGKTSPKDYTDSVQSEWETFQKSRKA